MTPMRAASLAALIFCMLSAPGLAEDVTLTSRDGAVRISGDLLSYDGEFYRVDSIYGVLTVDGSGVHCAGPGCPDIGSFVAEFTISGARTMGEVLLPALVEAFAARHGYTVSRHLTDDAHFTYTLTEAGSGAVAARIGFNVTSTAEGFADLLANEADLVLSTRPATEQERRLAREAGMGDLRDPRRIRIVALDAMVPVVAEENPLREASLETLARLFSGAVRSWADLGGPDAPVVLHLRDDQSGLAQGVEARLLAPAGLSLAENVIRHRSNADLADAVARDPLAIGVASFSETGNAAPVAIRGSCGMVSAPGIAAIKTEDYPLTMPLIIYVPARRMPVLTREFLAYVRSPAAQPVVDRAGFVDLRIQGIPVAAQGIRLANAIRSAGEETRLADLQRLVRRIDGAERLSLSFRFEPGGAVLDAQSQSNIEILARQLEAGSYDGRRLYFVGFTDAEGPAGANLALARRRAETVREAVLNAAQTADKSRFKTHVDAFGEAMPMACDDSEWGRQVNRRVEVWLKRGTETR